MGQKETVFDILCPLHVRFDTHGMIQTVGPTMAKLRPDDMVGRHMSDVFDLIRPNDILAPERVQNLEGARVTLRFADTPHTTFKGDISAGFDAFVLNLSFGHGVIDAIRTYDLTAADFANTDMTIELLYLLEAKSAMAVQVDQLLGQLQMAKSTAEHQANTDQLTGLKNRRALSVALGQLIEQASPFACMHLDLDYFKSVNDTYGHAAGDAVLERVAQVLNAETRSSDIVARVGGDEFVLVLDGITDAATLDKVAQRIITQLEVPVQYDGHLCRISGSAGTTISTWYDAPSEDVLLNDADMALYASKQAGRGRHTFFELETPKMH
ncbi:MAG: GGDEF domain-containing protein [Pseudomonadota bacterium]